MKTILIAMLITNVSQPVMKDETKLENIQVCKTDEVVCTKNPVILEKLKANSPIDLTLNTPFNKVEEEQHKCPSKRYDVTLKSCA